jgi:hypothetical protein
MELLVAKRYAIKGAVKPMMPVLIMGSNQGLGRTVPSMGSKEKPIKR